MSTFNIDPTTLTIAIGSFLLIVGQCCSCIRTSKKTAKYLSDREAIVRKKLENASKEGATETEMQEATAEYEAFQEIVSSRSYLHRLVVDPLDSMGEAINSSSGSFYWDLFVNNTFIGRVFTQKVVAAPIDVICQMLSFAGSLLMNSTLQRYINQHDPAEQDKISQQLFILVFVYTALFRMTSEIITSYTREYQGDISGGKNYAEIESRKSL